MSEELALPDKDRGDVIKDGETYKWTVELPRLAAGEYELYVLPNCSAITERDVASQESNRLRLDVLAGEPMPWHGLEVGIAHEKPLRALADGSLPLSVTFTNKGEKPLRFNLPKHQLQIDLSEDLVCYDSEGKLAYLSLRKDPPSVEAVRLEPGKAFVVSTSVPAQTTLVRVVFSNRITVDDAKADEFVPEIGYAFSQHLHLKKD